MPGTGLVRVTSASISSMPRSASSLHARATGLRQISQGAAKTLAFSRQILPGRMPLSARLGWLGTDRVEDTTKVLTAAFAGVPPRSHHLRQIGNSLFSQTENIGRDVLHIRLREYDVRHGRMILSREPNV